MILARCESLLEGRIFELRRGRAEYSILIHSESKSAENQEVKKKIVRKKVEEREGYAIYVFLVGMLQNNNNTIGIMLHSFLCLPFQ